MPAESATTSTLIRRRAATSRKMGRRATARRCSRTVPKAAARKYQVRAHYFAQRCQSRQHEDEGLRHYLRGFGTRQEKITRKTVT